MENKSTKLIDPEDILQMLEYIESTDIKFKGIVYSTRQYFFADPMIPMDSHKPAIGNKLAWEKFKCKDKTGYYVSMDANNFKLINTFGHDVGDNAIKSIGYALREATTGLSKSKLFRAGGDEFVFFTENFNEIDLFVTRACQQLDKIEPVRDSIKITLSFGIGKTYLEAESALAEAKER